MTYCIRYPQGGAATENSTLIINCKSSYKSNKDKDLVFRLNNEMEPCAKKPNWDRAAIRAEEKVLSFSRKVHSPSRKRNDFENFLQWFCNAWGEKDRTGKMQLVVETVEMGVTEDMGKRLIAMSTLSNVSNERRYYVKSNSTTKVAIRNLSNETIRFTPVHQRNFSTLLLLHYGAYLPKGICAIWSSVPILFL